MGVTTEMLNEQIVRDRLRQVRHALSKLDQEREVLLQMLRADERWLAWYTSTHQEVPPFADALPLAAEPAKKRVPLTQALSDVLRSAQGAPLHVKEIWARAQDLGATTTADSPLASVDFALFNLAKRGLIERCAPRTYRWIATDDQTLGGDL